MAKINDRDIKKWITDFKRKINLKYAPEKTIIFGSRARGDNLHESDIDIIIVSKKFKNIPWPRRIADIAELWNGLIAIEPLCYTPEEFKDKCNEIGIVQNAIKEGIEI